MLQRVRAAASSAVCGWGKQLQPQIYPLAFKLNCSPALAQCQSRALDSTTCAMQTTDMSPFYNIMLLSGQMSCKW